MECWSLGSGKVKINGYKNMDIKSYDGMTDLVHDISKPLPFENSTIDKFYASHIIEHFDWFRVETILRDWYSKLKEGGTLDVWTVNFDKLVDRSQNMNPYISFGELNWRLFNSNLILEKGKIADYNDYQNHRCMFNPDMLYALLKVVGFTKIERIPLIEYPQNPLHLDCNFGMRATK